MVLSRLLCADIYSQEINQKLNIDSAENIVKEKILINNGKIDRDALDYIFHILMVINPSIELYLLDPGGIILKYSAAPGKIKRESVSLEPIKNWLTEDITIPLLGEDPRNISEQKVFPVSPIHQQDKLEGYLYVILGGEKYDTIAQKIQDSFILKMSSWMIIAAITFTGIVGLLIFALLTRRLQKLTAGVDAFKKGQDLSYVIGDIGLVERVLENLISNALRHTPEGGTISIILKSWDEYMTVQVLDTGVGIHEEALPHIFGRFYKIDSKESASASLTGLGLAIAKRIMDLHGSGIEVDSESHTGTCFTFSFPIHNIS